MGSLERDVSGLEAIVLNLDESWKDFDMLESQMVQLLLDADNNRRFVPRGGPPEDELVSANIVLLYCCCCVVVCLEVS